MQALALADDTTGALEVGARFAGAGVRSLVALESGLSAAEEADADAVVLDLSTRHLPPTQASARARGVAAAARQAGLNHVFLKTDSTLRGPIGAHFQALLDVWPDRTLVYVPAYPALGREVVRGTLLVEGRPVHETAFSADPIDPVAESRIVELLAGQMRARILSVESAWDLARQLDGIPAGAVLVCDGSRESDLEAVAQVLRPRVERVLVGATGGFAGYWIRCLPIPCRGAANLPRARRWLVVNGSLHPRSREQTARSGLPRIRPGVASPAQAGWRLLEAPETRQSDPAAIAAALAASVREFVQREDVDGLVVFGGDTLRAILETLGETCVQPAGELLPGIPIARTLRCGLALISKAGGFGGPDLIREIRERLESSR